MTNTDVPDVPLVEARGLTIELVSGRRVVEDVSFSLHAGEALGLVGESGSGKTTTALALLGYARPGMRITKGTVRVRDCDIDLHDERAARGLRGRVVAHVPQDPATSLNPSLRIGAAIDDVASAHGRGGPGDALRALQRVHLPATADFIRRYPHELSGGQQQRVLIACALACDPPLVVLDEPTTGLDVMTQARVLEEIERLRTEERVAMVYVSHDLAVVAEVADQIAVMYAGRVVEQGTTALLLSRPRHPYTRGLISSIPDHAAPRRLRAMPGMAVGVHDEITGCAFSPRCPQRMDRCVTTEPGLELFDERLVRCFEAARTPPLDDVGEQHDRGATRDEALFSVEGLRAEHKGPRGVVVAADQVSFAIGRGECVALVGESGSGKTTIARAIVGLHAPAAGRLTLEGVELAARAQQRPREVRRSCQIVFQNPYESLNPRKRVIAEVSRPAQLLRGLSRAQAEAEAAELLARVRLPQSVLRRYPSELSGGERQRVAIARALAAKPSLLVCDEVTSALDVSVQAAVLELLAKLREELSLSLLFITHNLGVVASVADRVLILERGAICEEGPTERVFASPRHPYTVALLEAAPTLRRAAARSWA
jgi:peptide/nickel transport system ATP-binding protein